MARVTPSEVKDIIETDLGDTVIESYIAGATEIVTDQLGTDTNVSTALKKEIERWLTAHLMASTRVQQLAEAKAGSAEAKFQGQWGMNLKGTSYGQQVLVLDPTGKMAALGRKAATIEAVNSWND